MCKFRASDSKWQIARAGVLFFCVLLVLITGCTPSPDTGIASSNNDSTSELIELHNHYRHIGAPCSTDRQLPTLKVNAKLNAAAADQARKMASENRLRHQDNLGMGVQQHGYRYRVVAENIAQAPFGGDQLMQLWLTSQGHCDNIFNQQVSEIGIAQQGEFWAVILAQPH